ncbi:MAG: MBOAT family protein [Clostridia bacterium]|nr:MBOAT family protein [Clostridia bacterium]MBP3650392.1 MBOAT family protein [Clostridia bacterium]
MLFNSFAYAIFLPIVFIAYWALPHRFRWMLLLAASYYFYMSWNVQYVVLILLTTVISYAAAIGIEKAATKRRKKACVAAMAIVSLGVLFLFKYFNFAMDSISAVARALAIPMEPVTLQLLLPVGISFYTFQTLSYVVDVYRGKCPAEKHFGIYALFVSFFPQLVAGPIERTTNLMPQLRQEHTFSYPKATYGLKRMAWGFFKKIIVADTLAVYVNTVYGNLYGFSGFSLIVASVFFAFQIYCDFSGYSDIAIGTANLLGFDLMQNFRSPYFSSSVKEFWSRWHISLSTWFRDYVYIPLGGNRCGKLRHKLNLMITFLVSGLWHGANWTFVIWGALHGAVQVAENALPRKNKPSGVIATLLKTLAVFAFTTAAWVFFRADSLSSALYVFAHLFQNITSPVQYVVQGLQNMNLTILACFDILLMLLILLAFDFASLKQDVIQRVSSMKPLWRWVVYVVFLMLMLYLLPSNPSGEFIYFQF